MTLLKQSHVKFTLFISRRNITMKNFKAGLLFGFFTLCIVLTEAEIDYTVEEDNVIVLTEDDFDQAVKQFKYLLVQFYAPWCARCKLIAPTYSNASKLLQQEQSEVRLAKVDATEELELAEKYSVRSYPTTKFFNNGVASNYKLIGREAAEIVSWLKRKATGEVARTVETEEELKTLLENSDPVIIGFFKDKNSDSAKEFFKVANELEDLTFAVTFNPQLHTAYEAKEETVSIFKQSDEKRVDLTGPIEDDLLRDFIEINRLPLVVEFGPEKAPRVFERKIRKHAILFNKNTTSTFDSEVETFKEAAKQFKGKVIFILVDVDIEPNKKILDWFKLKRSDCPTVRLVDLEGPMNYKPESDNWKKIDITAFVQSVIDGKQKAYFISEDLPEDWDDRPVKKLVGKNFDEIARSKYKNSFVFFYAPWSDACKQLFPVWDELGEKFKKQNDIVIAKIDATANEVENVKITEFPSFLFFPRNSDEIISFTGERTLERFAKFVQRGGKLPAEGGSKDGAKKDEL